MPLAKPYIGASIFAYYAHSVDSNAPGEGCVESGWRCKGTCRLESMDLPSPGLWGKGEPGPLV